MGRRMRRWGWRLTCVEVLGVTSQRRSGGGGIGEAFFGEFGVLVDGAEGGAGEARSPAGNEDREVAKKPTADLIVFDFSREAARLKGVRPRLTALLKEMESHEAHLAREGRVRYDFSWLWKDLDLKP